MKIQPNHLQTLTDTLSDVFHLYPEFVAHFAANPKINDAAMAARWQLLREARALPWVCDTLYSYLNDDHIDTALRHVVRTLESTHA